jgi:hypothetical protein
VPPCLALALALQTDEEHDHARVPAPCYTTTTPLDETPADQPTYRTIILAISAISIFIVLFRFYGDVPVEYYRNYGPGEAIAPVTNNNDKPQPGYFKAQPEWDWSIPKHANSWDGYARSPRNRDVVVLTASDGGGHNSAIPNVLERVLDDREKYCAKHGYTNLWLNTSRYDIGEAHRVSFSLDEIHGRH